MSTAKRVQKRRALLSLWRNRLARSAVNRKVGGSSPPRDGGGVLFDFCFFFRTHSGLSVLNTIPGVPC